MAEKKFSLADAMRDAVGSASVTNMASGEHFVDVNNTSDEEITARILQLKIDAGNAILEIGRWLTVMKARLEHGKWSSWLAEQVDFSERIAQQYMQLYRAFEANPNTYSDLGKSKALKLLSITSAEEREQFIAESHIVNGEEKTVIDMTARELEQAIKERDEARRALDTALSDVKKAEEFAAALSHERDEARKVMDDALQDAKKAEERVKELENRPVDVAVQVDEDAIKKAADEARAAAEAEWGAKIKEVEDKLAKAKEKAKKAEEKAKAAGADSGVEAEKYKAEADRLRAELETARREQAKASISGDADLAAFQLLFEQVQTDVNKMRGILLKVRGRENSELGGKLTAALLALGDAVKESAA